MRSSRFDWECYLSSLALRNEEIKSNNLFSSLSLLSPPILGVKRVTWPPEHEYQARAASVTRQSPGFQPRQSPAPVPAPAPAQPQVN